VGAGEWGCQIDKREGEVRKMKVKELRGTSPAQTKTMADLNVGELAVVTEGTYKGEIVVRLNHYPSFYIASLSHKNHYWTNPNSNPIRVLETEEEVVLVNDK